MLLTDTTEDLPDSKPGTVQPAATHATGHLAPQQTLPTDSPFAANTDPADTGDNDQDADPDDKPATVTTGQRQQFASDGAPAHGPRQECTAQ